MADGDGPAPPDHAIVAPTHSATTPSRRLTQPPLPNRRPSAAQAPAKRTTTLPPPWLSATVVAAMSATLFQVVGSDKVVAGSDRGQQMAAAAAMGRSLATSACSPQSAMVVASACSPLWQPWQEKELVCEELAKDECAFAIDSAGKRCVLEYYVKKRGKTEYQCRTSEVVVEGMSEYIETDDCVQACGVDRNMVGISSEALLDSRFTAKLCSPSCFQNCPNILDLSFNLAVGEGVFLPDVCEKQRSNPRRAMAALLSSGAAPGPVPDDKLIDKSLVNVNPPAAAPAFL
ncbi:hypothetical protein Dimus_032886 [Dionaea muscipula]